MRSTAVRSFPQFSDESTKRRRQGTVFTRRVTESAKGVKISEMTGTVHFGGCY